MRVLLALVALAVVVACSEAPTNPTTLGRPSTDPLGNELANPAHRIDPRMVNAHAYGSFRVDGGGSTPAVITSGPANFPGAPKGGPGTCVNGLWHNSQGKPTSGTLTKPHPHCIKPSAAIEVVLEPVSACFDTFVGNIIGCPAKKANKSYNILAAYFGSNPSDPDGTNLVVQGYEPRAAGTVLPKSDGEGTITAYAIDATTLGTTNKRVGTLTFALTQYNSDTENHIPVDADGNPMCTVDPAQVSPCLNKVITAKYNPLPAPDGLGPTDFSVAGYLWLQPANAPFNYLDDEGYVRGHVCLPQFADRFFGGVVPVIPFSELVSVADVRTWCESNVAPADVTECTSRLAIVANATSPSGSDPCLGVV